MKVGREEPSLSSGPVQDLEWPGQPEGVEDQPKPRSTAAIFRELKNNRVALLMILGAVAAIGGFGYKKYLANQVVASVPAGPTQISIPASAVAAERNKGDQQVKNLDELTELAGADRARETGGSYIAPVAEKKEPVPPPAPPAAPPQAPVPKKDDAAENAAAARQQQADEKMLTSALKQIDAIEKQVYGDGKAHAIAVSNKIDPVAALTGGASGKADGVRLGLPMGTVWLAELPGGADSDRPGTIKASIEEGPFAGREALCNFTWPSREYINVECFAVKLDEESFPIKMVAVAPDEMPGIKAEYNGRYIARLGTQFLMALPSALADGLSRGGTTTVGAGGSTSTQKELNGKDLFLYAGGKATEPLVAEGKQIADEIKPQAKVPAKTKIGLMLAEDL